MKPIFLLTLFFVSMSLHAIAKPSAEEKKFYRDLVLKIRAEGEFKIPMPANGDMAISYKFEWDAPKWEEPIITDMPTTGLASSSGGKFFRTFGDKIFLKEGSFLFVGGEKIPLTCVHVYGQDNRFNGNSNPQFPEFVIKVMLVTNDWTCQGPITPGWPGNGLRKEAWETFIQYHIKDPTIMLPVDAFLRYRWNEFEAVLVK